MKHIYLPVSADHVSSAYQSYAEVDANGRAAKFVPAPGGCYFVTAGEWPKSFLSQLLKDALENQKLFADSEAS